MTLASLQQDPTQTPVTSGIGHISKKIINQKDYNMDGEQGRNQQIYNTNMSSVPYPTVEQQIHIDAMLSRWFHEEEHAQFRERISQLIDKKSAEHSDQKRPQAMPEQTIQTGGSRLEQTIYVNAKRQEQNSNDHKIQLDLDGTYEHWQEKKTYSPFKDSSNSDQRPNSPMQSDIITIRGIHCESSLYLLDMQESRAFGSAMQERPQRKSQTLLDQTHCIHSSFQGKNDIRITHCWVYKKTFTGNDPKPKPESSHMILNVQDPGELHDTRNEWK